MPQQTAKPILENNNLMLLLSLVKAITMIFMSLAKEKVICSHPSDL